MKKTKLLLMFISIMMLSYGLCLGTDYYVSPSGAGTQDGSTPADAMSLSTTQTSANPGDTFLLLTGDYGEVAFDNAVSRTSWADGVIYQSAPGEKPIFGMLDIIGNYNRYLTFKGINITSQNILQALVRIRDSSHVKIIDCNITGTWIPDGDRAAFGYNVSYGVYIDGLGSPVSDVLVDGCDIQGVGRGILFYHDIRDGIIARNNHIHKTAQSFIMTNTMFNNGQILIENNHLHDRRRTPTAHGSGIAVRDSHITIRGNTIHDYPGTGGIFFYGGPPGGHEDILIENNLVYDAQGTSHIIFNLIKKDITVRNNTFVGWHPNGVFGTSKYSSLITFKNGGSAENVFIYNNIFVGLTAIDSGFSNLIEDNNIFWALKYEGNYLDNPLGNNSIIIRGESGFNDGYDTNYFEVSGDFFVGGDLFDQYSFIGREADEAHKQNLNDAFVPIIGSDANAQGIITHGHMANLPFVEPPPVEPPVEPPTEEPEEQAEEQADDDVTIEKTVLSVYNNVLKASGNSQATIRCDLLEAGKLTVKIYDSKGREIVVLFDGQKAAGRHEFTWSGVDSGGSKVGSGIYMVYMKIGSYSKTSKIAVIK